MWARRRLAFGLLSLLMLIALVACNRTMVAADLPKLTEVRGIIHCHSIYSDGSGTVEEIAKAANAAKLDYLILSDHDTLKGLQQGQEKWYGSTLVLISRETTTPAGHLLTLGVPADFMTTKQDSTQVILDKVNQVGGVAVLAHPINSHYPWKDWNVHGYQGLEIVNLMEKMEEHEDSIKAQAMAMFMTGSIDYDALFKEALSTYPTAQLERWDQMTARGKVVMTGGSDAHAKLNFNGSVLKIPPYLDTFKAMQTHLLLSEPLSHDVEKDKKTIYHAIADGHAFIGYDVLGDTSGFRFYAIGKEKFASMGDSILFEKGMQLTVTAPVPSGVKPDQVSIRLLRHTATLAKETGTKLTYEPDRPGAYRVELWIGSGSDARLWALSNPIYINRGEL